jgi:hypothetical protein
LVRGKEVVVEVVGHIGRRFEYGLAFDIVFRARWRDDDKFKRKLAKKRQSFDIGLFTPGLDACKLAMVIN